MEDSSNVFIACGNHKLWQLGWNNLVHGWRFGQGESVIRGHLGGEGSSNSGVISKSGTCRWRAWEPQWAYSQILWNSTDSPRLSLPCLDILWKFHCHCANVMDAPVPRSFYGRKIVLHVQQSRLTANCQIRLLVILCPRESISKKMAECVSDSASTATSLCSESPIKSDTESESKAKNP